VSEDFTQYGMRFHDANASCEMLENATAGPGYVRYRDCSQRYAFNFHLNTPLTSS